MVLSMFVLFTANCTGFWQCVLGVITGALSLPRNILHSLLRHIRGKVGDDRVRFVKFDGGAGFMCSSLS